MKQILLILAALVLVGCEDHQANHPPPPTVIPPIGNPNGEAAIPVVEISNPIVEKAIRNKLEKNSGELTKADLAKVNNLVLINVKLTDLSDLEPLKQLESIHLEWNGLTSVKGLDKLTQLRKLTIAGNQLTTVKDLDKLTELESLSLSANRLTEMPMGLEQLTQLKVLNLEVNQLTDVTGLEKLTKLTILDLSNNQLTDVKPLEKLAQLSALHLHNNPDLTKAQIDELRKALPKCFITSNPKK